MFLTVYLKAYVVPVVSPDSKNKRFRFGVGSAPIKGENTMPEPPLNSSLYEVIADPPVALPSIYGITTSIAVRVHPASFLETPTAGVCGTN
jgi:hypothetical protein